MSGREELAKAIHQAEHGRLGAPWEAAAWWRKEDARNMASRLLESDWLVAHDAGTKAEGAREALSKVRQRVTIVSPYGHEVTESMARAQVSNTICDIEAEYRRTAAPEATA